ADLLRARRGAGVLPGPVLLDPHHLAQGQRGLLHVPAGVDPGRSLALPLHGALHPLERRPLLHQQPGDLLAQHVRRAGGEPAHRVRDRPLALRRRPALHVPARAAHAAGHRADHPDLHHVQDAGDDELLPGPGHRLHRALHPVRGVAAGGLPSGLPGGDRGSGHDRRLLAPARADPGGDPDHRAGPGGGGAVRLHRHLERVPLRGGAHRHRDQDHDGPGHLVHVRRHRHVLRRGLGLGRAGRAAGLCRRVHAATLSRQGSRARRDQGVKTMLRLSLVLLLAGLVALGGLLARPAVAARPYEGQTIRAVVNAEYVKYSLTLVEKDLYEKLGVKIETEVIPLDAFVSKTLLEFNSGSSPWDLVMFGPSNMPYDGDIHIMYWNKVAFERAENQKKFKAKYNYDLKPPKTWKQWDDAAEFFHGWGWDGSDKKLFGAGASYKPSGSGYSYHWWRSRFFSYGGQYFDKDMKPLINTAAGVRALEEMVKTMPYYPPGVLLIESEEPKTMLVKGEVPLLYSWTSTGKRVGNKDESV